MVQVSDKIERIGRRMRNVEEVFSAMKENLDSIMSNLQDGILLFTAEGRAALVSDSVERFLGIPRSHLFGNSLTGIFTLETKLGRLVRDAFDTGRALDQEEIETETGRRVQVSLDFVLDQSNSDQESVPGASLGALLTLHDLESVRELESELELSRRLAAIGRLTSGVGHEVKNPINAIVVHLELLRNKLSGPDARAMRHLEIIESEIQRLDRVVQTLVDFSRPVELQLKEQDLRRVVSGVLMLASAELETHNVRVARHMPERPLIAKVDADLDQAGHSECRPERRPGHGPGRRAAREPARGRPDGRHRDRRQRQRHPARHPEQDLRSLLHHPQGRKWYWPGHDLPYHSAA